MTDTSPLTGQFYCDALQYSVSGKPMVKAQCHCRECQYISGGGPNFFMVFPVSGFRWTKDRPQKFTRNDLDHPVTKCFCATCGTHITTELPDGERVVINVGTLAYPGAFGGPRAAIYTIDQQLFHLIPDGIPTFKRLS
ncbi:MAG: GFA family protein [Sulfitobacter sp.]